MIKLLIKLLRSLGSLWLTSALVLSIVGLYVNFTLFDDAFGRTMHMLWYTSIWRSVYFGLIVNLFIGTVVRVLPKAHNSATEMDTYIEIPNGDMDSVASAVRAMGLRPTAQSTEGLYATAGNLSFIPSAFLRVGITIFLLTVFITAMTARKVDTLFLEGDSIIIMGKQVELKSIEIDIPKEYIDTGNNSDFKISDIKAIFNIEGETIELDSSKVMIDGAFNWRLVHFGYNLQTSLDGQLKDFDLSILPPGETQGLRFLDGTIITIKLEPEREVKAGLLTGQLYNLSAPTYSFTTKGYDPVLIKQGEVGTVMGLKMELAKPVPYVTINLVKNKALPWLKVGLLFAFIGLVLLPMRAFWYTRSIHAQQDKDGLIRLGYEQEIMKGLGVYEFLHNAQIDSILIIKATDSTMSSLNGEDKP